MAQDAPRYKGFAAVEREARRQLEKYLDDCKSQFTLLSPEHQQAVVMQLRPLAQRSILHALEGRSSKPEKHFGYEWENALTEFNQNGIRGKAAKYLLESMPEISTPLTQPELLSRIQIEWLHE
jgi:hypothetical protein